MPLFQTAGMSSVHMLVYSDLDDYCILSLSAYFVRGAMYVIKVKKMICAQISHITFMSRTDSVLLVVFRTVGFSPDQNDICRYAYMLLNVLLISYPVCTLTPAVHFSPVTAGRVMSLPETPVIIFK